MKKTFTMYGKTLTTNNQQNIYYVSEIDGDGLGDYGAYVSTLKEAKKWIIKEKARIRYDYKRNPKSLLREFESMNNESIVEFSIDKMHYEEDGDNEWQNVYSEWHNLGKKLKEGNF